MQEIPILGTSFLDEDAQSYPGKLLLLKFKARLVEHYSL